MNQPIELSFKTQKNSKVLVNAIEQSSNSLKNHAFRNPIFSVMNLKFKKESDMEFDDPSLFILQPLKPFNEAKTTAIENEFNDNLFDAATSQNLYIPDIWFDDEFDITSEEIYKIQRKIPAREATWQVQGISMHPKKGFAVASYPIEINIPKTHTIKVLSPIMTRMDEIFEVRYKITKLVQEKIDLMVKVTVQNGDLFQKLNNNCRMIKRTEISSNLTLSGDAKSKQETIFVRSSGKKSIEVVVETNGDYYEDVTKIIKVGAKKEFNHSNIGAFGKLFKTSDIFSTTSAINESTNAVIIYGNLLSPMIGRFEEVL